MKTEEWMKKYIKDNALKMTQKEIANHLDINVGSVQYYVEKYGLYKKKYLFSDEDIKFMIDNYKEMSYREIAQILGFTEKQIKGKLNNMGYTKNRKINCDYFKSIDTPDKAYFLGFIFADGYIIDSPKNSNYEFGMELQSEDRYILEKLNEKLGGSSIIYHKNPQDVIIDGKIAHSGHSDVLRVYSKDLVYNLKLNGIESNKTYKNIYPVVSNELFFDFLRGYIDGDGCYYKGKYSTTMHITCAFDNALIYIKNILKNYDINTYLYKEKERKYRLYCCNVVSFTKLVNLLYYNDDVICLNRKYIKIKDYLLGSAA